MKHLIGGFALGFFIGLITVPAGEDKPISVNILAMLMAVACWGLLP